MLKAKKDPYMFEFVKHLIDDIIDEVWPDFEEEIIYQIDIKLLVPYVPEKPAERKICWLCYPCDCFRGWYLYAILPCK